MGNKELRNVYDFASDKVMLVSHYSAESMVTAGDPSPRQIMQMQQQNEANQNGGSGAARKAQKAGYR
jgi:hypothetical protein